MNCIIIDDEEMSREIISHFVEQTEGLELTKVYDNAIEAISFLQANHVDVLFLDIEMPQMTGIELIKTIPIKPQVVLVTSRSGYAVEAFEYKVCDYLVKPVTYSRFLKTVNKLKEEKESTPSFSANTNDIYVKSDSKIIKINLKDLLYIEALADYVILYTAANRHIVHSTMKGIEKKLSSSTFARVHRSYIINIEKIEFIEDLSILINKKHIPIGASYKESFIKKLNIL